MGNMHLAKLLRPVVKQTQVSNCLLFFKELPYVSNGMALQLDTVKLHSALVLPSCTAVLLLQNKVPGADLPAILSELFQRRLPPPALLE